VYGALFGVFVAALYHAMDALPNLKQGEVAPFVGVLQHVRESGLLARFDADMAARVADIEARAHERALEAVHTKLEALREEGGANCALPLLLLSDELETTAKKLDKRFPEPLLGYGLALRLGKHSERHTQPDRPRLARRWYTGSILPRRACTEPEAAIRRRNERSDAGCADPRCLCSLSAYKGSPRNAYGVRARVSCVWYRLCNILIGR
jgi:hypothetical protein